MEKSFFKVGFIGLGLMGNPMAKNIHQAGIPLIVYNREPKKSEEFKKMGVMVASSIPELASSVDVVITMVTGPEDVKEVLLGHNGVIKSGKKGLVAIDMSTIGPKAAQEIASTLEKAQIEFLDAPVTGSVERAKTGELTIFIGGKKEVFQEVKPVLEAMGKDLHYMGKTGLGQAIKLVNNLMVGVNLESLAEGMVLAEKLGLEKAQVERALENAAVVSPLLKTKFPKIVQEDFQTAFSLKNQTKDLKLAQTEALKAQITLPLLEKAAALYEEGVQKGLGDEDNSAIFKVVSSNAS